MLIDVFHNCSRQWQYPLKISRLAVTRWSRTHFSPDRLSTSPQPLINFLPLFVNKTICACVVAQLLCAAPKTTQHAIHVTLPTLRACPSGSTTPGAFTKHPPITSETHKQDPKIENKLGVLPGRWGPTTSVQICFIKVLKQFNMLVQEIIHKCVFQNLAG